MLKKFIGNAQRMILVPEMRHFGPKVKAKAVAKPKVTKAAASKS